MKCLSCRRKMAERVEETSRGPIHYDVCKTRGGMWFDVGEMDAMVVPLYESVEKASRDKAKNVSEPLRKCPRCKNQWLDKVFFLAYSQILLDHCENCHGFWLDGGEFKRINRELAQLKSQRGSFEKGVSLVAPFLNPVDLIWAFFINPWKRCCSAEWALRGGSRPGQLSLFGDSVSRNSKSPSTDASCRQSVKHALLH